MAVDKLKELRTALSVCKQMATLRQKDHTELHRALLAAGETPDENGSFMTTVHETVVSVRAAIIGVSEKTLPAFIGGEPSKKLEPNSAHRNYFYVSARILRPR